MPKLSGEDLLRSIGRHLSNAGVAVVLMSGDAEAEPRAIALGAAGFLLKPIELDTLPELTRKATGAVELSPSVF